MYFTTTFISKLKIITNDQNFKIKFTTCFYSNPNF